VPCSRRRTFRKKGEEEARTAKRKRICQEKGGGVTRFTCVLVATNARLSRERKGFEGEPDTCHAEQNLERPKRTVARGESL